MALLQMIVNVHKVKDVGQGIIDSMVGNVKLKLFVRIRQQTIVSCVYEFIVTSGQLFPVHGELNNTVLK